MQMAALWVKCMVFKFKEPHPAVASWICKCWTAVCCAAEPRNWPLRQLWRAEADHSWVRRVWAGSPEIDVPLSMGHEVLSYPKMCCSSTGCLILGDGLVTPGSIRDGLPEESGLSCLAAMGSPQIWYRPEQQTLPMPPKKKRILWITHQILCQFVPHRRNTETNSWNKNYGLCVLPHFLQKLWPKLSPWLTFWLTENKGLVRLLTPPCLIPSDPPQPG